MMYKIVEFSPWCQQCEHCKKAEDESPCDECLDEPVNQDSHRPVYYKEKEGKKQ